MFRPNRGTTVISTEGIAVPVRTGESVGARLRRTAAVIAVVAAVLSPAILVPLSAAADTGRATTAAAASETVYGPDGTHWPSRTPRADAARVVNAQPTWASIAAAIIENAVTSDPVVICVAPGTIAGGNGATSSSSGVLQNIGDADRASRILVTACSGVGTVKVGAGSGVAFVGVQGVSIIGIDFSAQNVMIRNSESFAIGYSKVPALLVTANGGNGVRDVEIVEIVAGPEAVTGATADRMEVKSAGGFDVDGLRFAGLYAAPNYKPNGSGAHTDTLQFVTTSGSGAIRNVTIEDSVLFQSSDQGIMAGNVLGGSLTHSAFFGGPTGQLRYPVYSGGDPITLANMLHGTWSNLSVADTIVAGSVSSSYSFAGVVDSRSSAGQAGFAALGTPTLADIDRLAPLPSTARLATIWTIDAPEQPVGGGDDPSQPSGPSTPAPADDLPTVARVSGADRFATAVAAAQAFAPFRSGTGVVYLTSGRAFPDALGAGALAAQVNGPVLLTEPNSLPASVRTELLRLHPSVINVVGGTSAVSAAVFAQVQKLGFRHATVRIGGADRYATNRALISAALDEAETVYLAVGSNFPDALAAGPAAAKLDGAVVLVNGATRSLDEATLDLLESLSVVRIRLVGGTTAISTGIERQLKALYPGQVTRIAGADRYDTAAKIVGGAWPGTADDVLIASGANFPDALAAGALGIPMLTTPANCIPVGTLAQLDALRADSVILVGGKAALSTAIGNFQHC
jgi:putative cell wall-binding protein